MNDESIEEAANRYNGETEDPATAPSPEEALPKVREWTLMFYFASDNPLAPGVVSQLKAIKSAGYHPEVNVITQFDPFNIGAPTHIFDVNIIKKLKAKGEPNFGFCDDPIFVRNMLFDRLWRYEKTRNPEITIRQAIKNLIEPSYNPPTPPASTVEINPQTGFPDEAGPKESLSRFLKFCRESYPAKHYILFLLGHGLIVGNDVFMFDAHATKPSISLVDLGEVLGGFRQKVENDDAALELVSFHSCSLSSAEVAFELRGTANYMLASQGPNFVGSWPYRSILLRIFKDVDVLRKEKDPEAIKENITETLRRIFYYILHNSTDFLFAGYSFDLCLCNLRNVKRIRNPIRLLAAALNKGLENERIKELIVLAHWESQSYWKENYTDLYDFCFCLARKLEGSVLSISPQKEAEISKEPVTEPDRKCPSPPLKERGEKLEGLLGEIHAACVSVMETLHVDSREVVSAAEFAGPAYQYSHGLSVYFPWTEPVADIPILKQYESYGFNETKWLEFLRKYFTETMRCTRRMENDQISPVPAQDDSDRLKEDIATLMYYSETRLGSGESLPDPVKTGPEDPTGDECNCPSIKNYPRDTRALAERIESPFKSPVPIFSGSFFNTR